MNDKYLYDCGWNDAIEAVVRKVRSDADVMASLADRIEIKNALLVLEHEFRDWKRDPYRVTRI